MIKLINEGGIRAKYILHISKMITKRSGDDVYTYPGEEKDETFIGTERQLDDYVRKLLKSGNSVWYEAIEIVDESYRRIHERNTNKSSDEAKIVGERNYDGVHAFLVNSILLDDMYYVNILMDILPEYRIDGTGFSDEVAIFAPEDELDIVQDGIDTFNRENVGLI